MNPILKTFLSLLSGPTIGFITKYVMDLIDDVLKVTANWPDQAKQAIVIVLSAALPVLGQLTGITLPSDPTQLATQPVVQSLVAAAFAFFLKHVNDKKTTVVSTPIVAASVANSAAPVKV